MMTEQQAREKWCPFNCGFTADCKCIASDCMMWRWDTDENGRLIENPLEGTFSGYCGLGGAIYQPRPSNVIIADPGDAGLAMAKRTHPDSVVVRRWGPNP